MLSHHAPPARLLRTFQRKEGSTEPPVLWVYSKTRTRRSVTVTSISAENGYFSGDPNGRTEEEIDKTLNDQYEGPFNKLLPGLCSGLLTHLDPSIVPICSRYMSNLLLRSKPRREATKTHSFRFNEEFERRLQDRLTLRRYAAKVSFHTRTSVPLDVIADASRKFLGDESQSEAIFLQSATTEFSKLPETLMQMHWIVCHSPHLELIQSDAAIALLNRPPVPNAQTHYGDGIAKYGSRWYLPISPRYSLRASADYIADSVLTFQDADQINEYLVRAAHGFVYSSSYDPRVERFTREHLNSLRFFEQLITVDVRREVEEMFTGLLQPDEVTEPGAPGSRS